MFDFIKVMYFLCITLFTINNSYAQTPDATGNFVKPEIEITTTPEFPGICSLLRGVVVTCNEDFNYYSWKHLPSGEIVYEGVDEQSVTIVPFGNPEILPFGKWELTIQTDIDGISCSRSMEFEVFDLADPSKIQSYFENAGFYAIPIWRDEDISGVCNISTIKYNQNSTDLIDLNSSLIDVMNNFKPIKDFQSKIITTKNECLCGTNGESLIESFESQLYEKQVGIWAHTYFENKLKFEGIEFVKGQMPYEYSLPLKSDDINFDHFRHLEIIHDNILLSNTLTSDQSKVIHSNIFMPHPLEGYNGGTLCNNLTTEQLQTTHFLTPAQIPVKLSSDFINIKFTANQIEENAPYGTILGFENAGNYKSYYEIDYEDRFLGFYDDLQGEFYEDFDIEIPVCRGACFVNLTMMVLTCDGTECNFESDTYSSEDFDDTAVADGGYGYALNKCESAWNESISKAEAKEFVYNLLCALRNNDISFYYEDKYRDKIVFARDIYIQEAYYPYVGVVMPQSSSSNTILLNSALDLINGGVNTGFENSYNISIDNNEVRLNFFDLGNYEFNDKTCSVLLKTAYDNDFWNFDKYWQINICLNQSDKVDVFKEYVYKTYNTDNLLLFVNGYRFNGSPVDMAKELRFQYPTKSTSEAVDLCNDNYEGGNYWNDIGNTFIKEINNKNVVYLDGHDNISTSNHHRMVSYLPFQTSFAASLLPCIGLRKTPLQPGCNLCSLNEIPNPDGFTIRYERGKLSGQEIFNKIVSGKIKVKRDALGRISGKIDIVAHSMGYAYAKGVADFLKPYLATNNKLGYFYVIAPENAIGHPTSTDAAYRLNVANFDGVWQYGTNFTNDAQGKPYEEYCFRDGVAPQIRINGLDPNNNVFIPTTENYKSIRDFLNAHYVANYGWIFTEPLEIGEGKVIKRNP